MELEGPEELEGLSIIKLAQTPEDVILVAAVELVIEEEFFNEGKA